MVTINLALRIRSRQPYRTSKIGDALLWRSKGPASPFIQGINMTPHPAEPGMMTRHPLRGSEATTSQLHNRSIRDTAPPILSPHWAPPGSCTFMRGATLELPFSLRDGIFSTQASIWDFDIEISGFTSSLSREWHILSLRSWPHMSWESLLVTGQVEVRTSHLIKGVVTNRPRLEIST